jgi:hypothetical protein
MHETWPGAKLNDADKQLLQKVVNADLRDLDEESQSGTKSAFSTVDTADTALGTLGKGVISFDVGLVPLWHGRLPDLRVPPRKTWIPESSRR